MSEIMEDSLIPSEELKRMEAEAGVYASAYTGFLPRDDSRWIETFKHYFTGLQSQYLRSRKEMGLRDTLRVKVKTRLKELNGPGGQGGAIQTINEEKRKELRWFLSLLDQ